MNSDIADSISESGVAGDDASPTAMVALAMLRHSPFLRKCGQLHQWWSESGDVCLDRVQAAAAQEYWSGAERREFLAVAGIFALLTDVPCWRCSRGRLPPGERVGLPRQEYGRAACLGEG